MEKSKKSDLHRHYFKKSLRPKIITRKGSEVFIDYVETSSRDITNKSYKLEISPRELCVKIGQEVVRRLEGRYIRKKLDILDAFQMAIKINSEDKEIKIVLTLRLVKEGLTRLLKTIAAD